jgi:arylsulfatase A-like enzyme
LRGLKFTLYEGGIRVPFLARWPGRVPRGRTSDFPSAFWDMLPTFAEVAGAEAPKGVDGVSILPTLLGKPDQQPGRAYLYWEHAPTQALRLGDWKGFRPAPDRPLELYDLAKDVGEKRDVAAEHPDVVARIEKLAAAAHVEAPEFPLKGKQPKK